jgi:hypothetical protein
MNFIYLTSLRFSCQKCDKRFTYGKDLKKHVAVAEYLSPAISGKENKQRNKIREMSLWTEKRWKSGERMRIWFDLNIPPLFRVPNPIVSFPHRIAFSCLTTTTSCCKSRGCRLGFGGPAYCSWEWGQKWSQNEAKSWGRMRHHICLVFSLLCVFIIFQILIAH